MGEMKGEEVIAKAKRGRDKYSKYEPIFVVLIKICSHMPKRLRHRWLRKARSKNGLIGIGLRYVLLKTIAERCGRNVAIDDNVYILNPEHLCLGDNVSINPMTYIQARGRVIIGNDVSIGHMVTIMSSEHVYDSIDMPIKNQGIQKKEVIIGDGAWIGAKATLLMGVRIGCGAIVGAGAVVTKDVDEYTVVAGVPAKPIRKRY